MHLKSLELAGFKSFAKKTSLDFKSSVTAIVGPNGSGKSNIAEAFRFVLGEQSIKSLRGKRGEDLIFNGSKGLPRMNRGSVKITLDNADRKLPVDFDEVIIERAVHRDGVNEYSINGSQVRLRDIIELLSSVHVGGSAHHIISQGEADRILNAAPKERKNMVEEALGLKLYQYKRVESQKKLEKTEENMKSIESLRHEIAPHLKFLRKQMEKVEKAKEIKTELTQLYQNYLAKEEHYLAVSKKLLHEEGREPEHELRTLEKKLADIKQQISDAGGHDKKSSALIAIESTLRASREKKDEAFRKVGRIEGELAALSRRIEKMKSMPARTGAMVPLAEIEELERKVAEHARESQTLAAIDAVRELLHVIHRSIESFIGRYKIAAPSVDNEEEDYRKLGDEKKAADEEAEKARKAEEHMYAEYAALRESIEKEKDTSRDAERDMFKIMARQSELRGKLSTLYASSEKLAFEENAFKQELEEATRLVGREALHYQALPVADALEDRAHQINSKKNLERLKFKLEDYGASGGSEIEKEFKEAEERDGFLTRELIDLEQSAASLRTLIVELEGKIEVLFEEGVGKINKAFQHFFALMFGGGSASITLVKPTKKKAADDLDDTEIPEYDEQEEEEGGEGIDIGVTLPHKKTKGLVMLSGGERALTSIALLFAISQVNPPPFVILDETDAALDEANSRKYGDMIEDLSKVSQLILITHNRETMSRAGILYGVTMGGEGVSKLLSIHFEEAVAVAK